MAFVDLLAIVLLAGVVYLIAQQRRGRGDPAPTETEATRLAGEVRELRARIQVLERVITDQHGSADLSSEIERLRDR